MRIDRAFFISLLVGTTFFVNLQLLSAQGTVVYTPVAIDSECSTPFGNFEFGASIAALGDLNNPKDGVNDFGVSCTYDEVGGIAPGSVFIFSGADQSLISQISGSTSGERFGQTILEAVSKLSGWSEPV